MEPPLFLVKNGHLQHIKIFKMQFWEGGDQNGKFRPIFAQCAVSPPPMLTCFFYYFRFTTRSRHVEIEHKDSFLQSYENLLRKKESRLTRISICIVWLFIICHIWKLIPTIYELLYSEVSNAQWCRLSRIVHFSVLSTALCNGILRIKVRFFKNVLDKV